MTDEDWRPSASVTALRLRAEVLTKIRAFFAARGVLEVETPLLGSTTATDLHLNSLKTKCHGVCAGSVTEFYLQTSPESAMKRLLAAGSGPVFQICKAFRDGESGALHNLEFTLLEWYRPGFDCWALMEEVRALLGCILGSDAASCVSYGQAFQRTTGLDPFTVTTAELRGYVEQLGLSSPSAAALDHDSALDLAFAQVVVPRLSPGAVFVYHFPSSQAQMARLSPDNQAVAERFELLLEGVELANGYEELGDSEQQRRRFAVAIDRRRQQGLATVPLDTRLLRALEFGLPDCAGVALGLDRLVMLAAGAQRLEEVLAFPVSRA
jgi:lysyl-tRNA synthetase class 2